MRTSNAPAQSSRILPRILKVLLAVAFFAACNAAITFALVPYGSKSQVIWSDYKQEVAVAQETGEGIDTLFIGTSMLHHAVNPVEFDKLAGTHSFNMATPMQTIDESMMGIQTAYEDFGIKRVVLGVSWGELRRGGASGMASPFTSERGKAVGPARQLQTTAKFLFGYGYWNTVDSINFLFPWSASYVGASPGVIMDNVRLKLSGLDVYEAGNVVEPDWHHVGQGYGEYSRRLDYDDYGFLYYSENPDAGAICNPTDPISANRAARLREICEYCAAHDIELTVVGLPLPAFNIVSAGEAYDAQNAELRALLAGYDEEYYDFALAKPELFDPQPDWYYDFEHLSDVGGRAFTEMFAQFLARVEAGEDVSDLFYDSWADYVASVNYLSAVWGKAAADGEGVHLTAQAFCSPAVRVEYQFQLLDSATGAWRVVRDWSPEATYDYAPEERGALTYRVLARAAGGAADGAERSFTTSVYW